MANARTNSLHDKLPVELRKTIERDLVEQPPGRATYQEVFDHHGLAELGVGIKSLQRYGGYLRALARNRWIGELADSVAGKDVGDDLAGLIRSRLFEALVCGETKIADLMRAAVSVKTLTDADAKVAEMARKEREIAAALAKGERQAKQDPEKAYADMADSVRQIFGLSEVAA